MSHDHLATIVVNNYNYGRFLRDAIDSALEQTYPRVEVIVVDDGSTDDSRAIIASYGDRIVPLLKENGGQASAFNAGFETSRGEVVCFLDADDRLLPTAIERAICAFADPAVVKAHWPLWTIDEHGHATGSVWPRDPLPDGDFLDTVIQDGPSAVGSPPTSGNAWRRGFLEAVMPVSAEYRLCADDYLYAIAPAFGPIRRIPEPQGCYRIHGRNNYQGRSFDQKLTFGMRVQAQQCAHLANVLRRRGIDVDPEQWKRKLWFFRLCRAAQSITALVPPDARFVLVDEDQWGVGEHLAGRRRLPFPERQGQYWGPPADDAAATQELERVSRAGAEFVVVAWPAFWWLDHYVGLNRRLRSTSRCILENDDIVIFDLRQDAAADRLQAPSEL